MAPMVFEAVEAGDPLQRTDSISNTNAAQGRSMGLFPSYPKIVVQSLWVSMFSSKMGSVMVLHTDLLRWMSDKIQEKHSMIQVACSGSRKPKMYISFSRKQLNLMVCLGVSTRSRTSLKQALTLKAMLTSLGIDELTDQGWVALHISAQQLTSFHSFWLYLHVCSCLL